MGYGACPVITSSLLLPTSYLVGRQPDKSEFANNILIFFPFAEKQLKNEKLYCIMYKDVNT